jgi:hypothetical protein
MNFTAIVFKRLFSALPAIRCADTLKSKMNQRTQFELQVVAFEKLPQPGRGNFATFESQALKRLRMNRMDYAAVSGGAFWAGFNSCIPLKRVADKQAGIPGAEYGTYINSVEFLAPSLSKGCD